MQISMICRQIWRELWSHKQRTFLLILGIAVGICSLTMVVSISEGVKKRILDNIEKFFVSNPIQVWSGGGRGKVGPPANLNELTITYKDVEDIARIPGVHKISSLLVKMVAPVRFGNQNRNSWIIGTRPNWPEIWGREMAVGDFITEGDDNNYQKVCVIGETVRRELFGEENPLNKQMKIEDTIFTIKGVIKRTGLSNPMGRDADDIVVIPLNTAARRLLNQPRYLSALRIIAKSPDLSDRMPSDEDINNIAEKIKIVLRENHHLGQGEEDDFRIRNPIGAASRTLQKDINQKQIYLMYIITGVILIVSGVVLMNIMLISVTQRRKEIGLRISLGAKKRDIAWQFLIESLFITTAGSLLGLISGFIFYETSRLIPQLWEFLQKPEGISFWPFIIAILSSLIIGTISGIWPAKRAAELNPIETLKN